MFTESLFAAALTLSAWHGDAETNDEREARLRTISFAINIAALHATCADDAPHLPALPESSTRNSSRPCKRLWRGDPRELAFLLLTQAYFETRLAQHVHSGNCRVHLGECDGGRAIGLWQLQSGAHLPKERWEQLAGTGLASTAHAAYEASRALSRGRNFCGSTQGAVSLYATGRTCRWKPAKQRVSFLQRLAARQ